MNLLLDSRTLLWAMHKPGNMRSEAAEAISDPGNAVFYSAASVWELELKAAKRKLTLPEVWLEGLESKGLLHLPVTAAEVQVSARLPRYHADPFDRLLVAQSRAHGLTTRDPQLLQYGVPVLEV